MVLDTMLIDNPCSQVHYADFAPPVFEIARPLTELEIVHEAALALTDSAYADMRRRKSITTP
jgi:hypothetical protein